MNPVEQFPPFIKPTDIRDATQYSMPVVYQLIREMEVVPGIVYRRESGRGIRVNRDKFFRWFMEREGMDVPEGLRGA